MLSGWLDGRVRDTLLQPVLLRVGSVQLASANSLVNVMVQAHKNGATACVCLSLIEQPGVGYKVPHPPARRRLAPPTCGEDLKRKHAYSITIFQHTSARAEACDPYDLAPFSFPRPLPLPTSCFMHTGRARVYAYKTLKKTETVSWPHSSAMPPPPLSSHY